MATEFEVSRPIGRCAISGRTFNPGETFFSAVFETAEGFERRDYSAESWTGPPEGAICTFRTRIVLQQEKPRTFVDDQVLLDFFLRLADEKDDARQNFRFVLMLILMRKRLLKFEQTVRTEGVETWQVRLTRDDSVHHVPNRPLNEDQIAALTQQLSVILADAAGEIVTSDANV